MSRLTTRQPVVRRNATGAAGELVCLYQMRLWILGAARSAMLPITGATEAVLAPTRALLHLLRARITRHWHNARMRALLLGVAGVWLMVVTVVARAAPVVAV